jgi:hypothetical protein
VRTSLPPPAKLFGAQVYNFSLRRRHGRKLVDHQPDCRILADALGVDVFVLVHFAAGIGDRQCDAARIAGARVDDHQRVAEAATMGAFVSDMSNISVKERGCS